MRPIKVYIFKEGIVRFSSERYDMNQLGNLYSHLTNSSINKHASTNVSDTNGSGLKWSLQQLRSYFMNSGHDFELMWARIEQIVQLTCINLCSLVPDLKCCFEILGFDIIIDANMKPWLLEVNSSPALSMETNIDHLVKPALIKDALGLTKFESYQTFMERSRVQQSRKTSNIHSNFFSKRTAATHKNEEKVLSPMNSGALSAKQRGEGKSKDLRASNQDGNSAL